MEIMLEATVIGQDWVEMDTEAFRLVHGFFNDHESTPSYSIRDVHTLIVAADGEVASWEGTVVVTVDDFRAWVTGP